MRKRWIYVNGQAIPAEEYEAQPQTAGFFVMDDLKPYKSMITGEMIEGRAAHRAHLKQHNKVEVGDAFDKATPRPYTAPAGLKETIARQVYEKLRY